MPEQRTLDLAALQAPRAAGRRLLRLAVAPGAMDRLSALNTWPACAAFEPLAAMNARQTDGPPTPGDAGATATASTPRRGTLRPAPHGLPATPGQRSASTLQAPSVTAAQGPASAAVTTPAPSLTTSPSGRPARLPDPREVAAVMEALLRRPHQGSALTPLPPVNTRAVSTARLPAPQTAAALLGALVATTARRGVPSTGHTADVPANGRPPLADAEPTTRERRALAALQDAAQRPPVLDPISTLYRPQPHGKAPVPPSGGVHLPPPNDLAPRAVSRLLAPPAVAASSRQHLETPAPDADGDELLDAITRGLVDQAWLRGVNLG